MARVVIVEDHLAIAEGTKALLESEGYEVLLVKRPKDVDRTLEEKFAEVAIVDLVFTDDARSGIDVIEDILERSPGTRIILFTAGDQPRRHHLATALARYPVSGGLPKSASKETLFECVRVVLAGGTFFDPEIEAFRPPAGLDPSEELMRTPAHAAIWCALAAGARTRRALANATRYSERTIGNSIGPMGDKLHELGLVDQQDLGIADLASYAERHKEFFQNWEWRRRRPWGGPRTGAR